MLVITALYSLPLPLMKWQTKLSTTHTAVCTERYELFRLNVDTEITCCTVERQTNAGIKWSLNLHRSYSVLKIPYILQLRNLEYIWVKLNTFSISEVNSDGRWNLNSAKMWPKVSLHILMLLPTWRASLWYDVWAVLWCLHLLPHIHGREQFGLEPFLFQQITSHSCTF